MDVEHENPELEQLEADPAFTGGLEPGIVKAFRKRMQQIRSAVDERDFYALRSLRFKRLKGNRRHQQSMRLNDQWRLIVKIKGTAPHKTVAIIGIEDYH